MNRINYAYLDENSKKEIRRTILKAVSIPGYQVPFASRELPIARGWGTGGLQITLSLVGDEDILKVIDQGSDESVNAVNIKKFVVDSTGVDTTIHTSDATIIQSRHRVPEVPLNENQILVLQVPMPEPLRSYERHERKTKEMHGHEDYSVAWINIFEQIVKFNKASMHADYPVIVNNRYLMAPSPIPRFDNPKLDNNNALILLGAGREKKIYAIPPFTNVKSIDFDDYPFEKEDFKGKSCKITGATDVFLDEIKDEKTGEVYYQTNDQSYMLELLNEKDRGKF